MRDACHDQRRVAALDAREDNGGSAPAAQLQTPAEFVRAHIDAALQDLDGAHAPLAEIARELLDADDVDDLDRPRWATVAANVCFVLSAICVLVGIYLIVPALHG